MYSILQTFQSDFTVLVMLKKIEWSLSELNPDRFRAKCKISNQDKTKTCGYTVQTNFVRSTKFGQYYQIAI